MRRSAAFDSAGVALGDGESIGIGELFGPDPYMEHAASGAAMIATIRSQARAGRNFNWKFKANSS